MPLPLALAGAAVVAGASSAGKDGGNPAAAGSLGVLVGTAAFDGALGADKDDGRKNIDLGIGLGFYRNLDEQQCAILLEYIGRLSREWDGDAQIDRAGTDLSREIESNMFDDIEELEDSTSLEVVHSAFDTRISRIAFLMELLRAGMSSGNFNPERSLIVGRISEVFSIDDETMETILSYLKDERELVGNTERLMEG